MRRLVHLQTSSGPLAVACAALLSSACAGLGATVVDPWSAHDAATELARDAVSSASARSFVVSRETVDRLVERRVASANGLVEAVVAVLRGTRLAAPTTRSIDPTALAETRELLAIALEHVGSRRAEAIWSVPPLSAMLDEARSVLDEASDFLGHCEAGRTEDADVAYDRLFLRYDAFRATAGEVARTGAADPLRVWARSPSEGASVDDATASR